MLPFFHYWTRNFYILLPSIPIFTQPSPIMKSIRNFGIFLLIATAVFSFTSCESDKLDSIRGSGPVYAETRDLPIHRDISIAIPADVFIYQSQVKEVTIEAQANILEVIETHVQDSELEIKLKKRVELGTYEPIKVYISSAMFNTIHLSGTVNLYSETPIVTDVLDVSISGTGEVDILVTANMVKASISGNGKMWLDGKTISEVLTISGTGNIYAFGLLTESSDISISGTGNAEISVKDHLKADISGSGNIYYRGYPSIDSRIIGTGRLIHVD